MIGLQVCCESLISIREAGNQNKEKNYKWKEKNRINTMFLKEINVYTIWLIKMT